MSDKKSLPDHMIDVEFKLLTESAFQNNRIPNYTTAGSAAMDLISDRPGTVRIEPGEVEKIGTGIAVWIKNPAVLAFVLPRSGRATKEGLTLANTVGLIDSDYQGEIIVAVRNTSNKTLFISEGERIAQLVFMPVLIASLLPVSEFSDSTARGTGGYGSTGNGSGTGNGSSDVRTLVGLESAVGDTRALKGKESAGIWNGPDDHLINACAALEGNGG